MSIISIVAKLNGKHVCHIPRKKPTQFGLYAQNPFIGSTYSDRKSNELLFKYCDFCVAHRLLCQSALCDDFISLNLFLYPSLIHYHPSPHNGNSFSRWPPFIYTMYSIYDKQSCVRYSF